MNVRQQQAKAVVPGAPSTRYTGEASRHSTAVKSHLEEEPIWNPESQFPAPVAVLQLVTGRWVANIVSDAKQMTAEIDLIGPRVEFLINPNDGTLCVIKDLIRPQVGR